MKYFLLLFCLLTHGLLLAQRSPLITQEKESKIITLSAEIDFETNTVSNPVFSETAIIKNPRIELANGDILIKYELDRNKRGFYSIDIVSITDERGTSVPIKPENIYGDLGKDMAISRKDRSQKRILFLNTADNTNLKWLGRYVQFELEVKHYVLTNLKGVVIDCNNPPPDLALNDFTPELIFGGIGLVTVGVGFLIEKDSDERYAEYGTQDFKSIADPIYDEANNLHQDALITKGVGAAFLAGSLVFAAKKYFQNRRDHKYHRRYCNSTSSLEPYYRLNTTPSAPRGQVGLSFKLSF